jgi:hypothetical protein
MSMTDEALHTNFGVLRKFRMARTDMQHDLLHCLMKIHVQKVNLGCRIRVQQVEEIVWLWKKRDLG